MIFVDFIELLILNQKPTKFKNIYFKKLKQLVFLNKNYVDKKNKLNLKTVKIAKFRYAVECLISDHHFQCFFSDKIITYKDIYDKKFYKKISKEFNIKISEILRVSFILNKN